mmetsp:Transcript_94928/g.277566  ORF Transcript_94928/g.277566 Transcript_94928/m.277566 type:complete len:722 (+) Transcript_94928:188-2353(+)
MVSSDDDDTLGTPRGEAELLDFDELDKLEAERACELGEEAPTAEPPAKPKTKKERPFKDIEELRVGMKVQVLSDGAAVLQACRQTGIDRTYDEQRLASLGKEVAIQSKDPSDNTVKCKVPELGPVWFGIYALMPAQPIEHDADYRQQEAPSPGPEPFASEWWSHMSGLAVGDQGEADGRGDVHAGTHDDSRAVMMELEMEAAIERRLCEGAREGKLGSVISIVEAEAVDSEGHKKRTFVTDAMLAAVVRFRKLCGNPVQVASVGAGGLEYFVMAVAYLLCTALPCHFSSGASTHFERLVRLFKDSRRGFLHLVEELLREGLSHSQLTFSWKRLYGLLNDIVCCLGKLLGCLLATTPAEQEVSAAALAELAAIVSSGLEYRPEWLASWAESMKRFGKGKTLIVRTSPVTICQLLHELRAGFQAERFQQRYQELRNEARHGGEAHIRMVEWTFDVQRRVLVRYGFEATPKGVWDMRHETGYHADGTGETMQGIADEVVAKLRRDIHVSLEMDARKSLRLPVFHTVGDSHSRFGWPPCVIQHWQGPLLCFNVDRVDLRKMHPPIRGGDAICLCFGEIDCRCHVHKHVTEDRTYQVVIDGIIERYFKHLREQERLLPPAVRIFVYNVLPPVRKANAELNTDYPYLGEDEERLAYVRYFNNRLKQECHHTDFRFFEVYDQYADDEGFLSEEYSDGNVHVANGVWIDEVIRGLNLKPVWVSELSFAG